jgi:hypothetical protein
MPLINVKLVEGMFSPQQKQEIVETPTDAMVSIEREHAQCDMGRRGGSAKRRLGYWRQSSHDPGRPRPGAGRAAGGSFVGRSTAVVIVFMVTLAIGGVALATPGSGISAEVLASGTLQDDSDISTALGGLRRRPPSAEGRWASRCSTVASGRCPPTVRSAPSAPSANMRARAK